MFSQDRLSFFVIISLILHLLLVSIWEWSPKEIASPAEEVQLFLKDRQIADIEPPEREERPDDAKFLGLYDSRTDEENVALSPYIPPSRRRIATTPEGRALDNLSQEGGSLEDKEPDLASALPEDFFPNIRIGDKTYLNVLRYPKISYFVRLKKVIKLTWNPAPVINHYYFSSQISSGQIEATIALQIDSEGNMKKIFVAQSSGFPMYDDEALRAIEDSAPFAAPPKELLDNGGVLPIIYTFVVYL